MNENEEMVLEFLKEFERTEALPKPSDPYAQEIIERLKQAGILISWNKGLYFTHEGWFLALKLKKKHKRGLNEEMRI